MEQIQTHMLLWTRIFYFQSRANIESVLTVCSPITADRITSRFAVLPDQNTAGRSAEDFDLMTSPVQPVISEYSPSRAKQL